MEYIPRVLSKIDKELAFGTRMMPEEWKWANAVPVSIKKTGLLKETVGLVSLTPVPGKNVKLFVKNE